MNNKTGKVIFAVLASCSLVLISACSKDDDVACTVDVGIATGCTNTTPTNCRETLNGTPHPGESCADLGFTSS